MATLKALVDETTNIKNELVACHNNLKTNLIDKGVEVNPGAKMSTLIDNVGDIRTGISLPKFMSEGYRSIFMTDLTVTNNNNNTSLVASFIINDGLLKNFGRAAIHEIDLSTGNLISEYTYSSVGIDNVSPSSVLTSNIKKNILYAATSSNLQVINADTNEVSKISINGINLSQAYAEDYNNNFYCFSSNGSYSSRKINLITGTSTTISKHTGNAGTGLGVQIKGSDNIFFTGSVNKLFLYNFTTNTYSYLDGISGITNFTITSLMLLDDGNFYAIIHPSSGTDSIANLYKINSKTFSFELLTSDISNNKSTKTYVVGAYDRDNGYVLASTLNYNSRINAMYGITEPK